MSTITHEKTMSLGLAQIAAVLLLSLALIACAGSPHKESTGEYLDNTVITTKVKAALLKSPVAKVLDIKVESHKGVVQLSGFVDSKDQKAEAEKIARAIAGVRDVENDIIVKY